MAFLDYTGLSYFFDKLKALFATKTELSGKANSSHGHGSITNDGKIGTASGKPIITGSGGAIQAGSFGTTAGTFCQGNDSRLSDARAPTSHTHAAEDVTSGTFNAGRIPNLAASKITSGTFDAARIPSLDASKITSGTISIDRLPAGALERLVTVADQAARFALTTSDVQLGDTVKQLDNGLMYYVVDTSKLGQAAGYSEYTAGAASSVPWSGVTGKPSTFAPASHTHGNLTNDGKLGTASAVVMTDTSKKIIAQAILPVANGGTGVGELLEDETANDFDDYVTPGTYHVRVVVAETLNHPMTETSSTHYDGILTVKKLSTASNVSANIRVLQVFTICHTTQHIFCRLKGSAWYGWQEMAWAKDVEGKASVASPTFTGTPKAPTAAAGTNTTQIATTAFVQDAIANQTAITTSQIDTLFL